MSDGARATYAELDRDSRRLARLLRERGVAPGDTLAIVMENRIEWGAAMWAGMRSGLFVAPLNSHLVAGELAFLLADSGATAVLTSASREDAVADAIAEAGVAPRVALAAGGGERLESWEDAVAGVGDEPLDDERLGARMLYSSGTTGRPKGIRQPLRDLHPADAPPRLGPLMERLRVGPDTVFLSPAPNYHAAPFTFMLVVHMLGGTLVSMPRFDAAEVLATIARERCTHAQFVPTMLSRLLRLPGDERARHDLSSLQVAMTSGAPCPDAVKRAIIDWWGPVLHEYYGASEGYGQTHITAEEWLERPGSVGRALKGTIHVTDPASGEELPTGEVGRIWFEGTDPVAYHGDEEKSRRARNERPWSTVGDLGRLDDDGYLFLAGRESHTIISGGVNVYPQEIEDVLAAHPGVADVAVIGVPDDDLGEAVHAVVVPAPGADGATLAEEVVAFCRGRLAGFKRPRGVDLVDELPRNAAGKLLKDEVRRPYWPAERVG